MSDKQWTIEPHGDGYALYSGRGPMQHGMNLVYLSEPDSNWEDTKRLIEAAPRLLAIVKRLQSAFGEFCCDNCITESDLEDGGNEILQASRAADELLKELEGE